MEPMWRTGSNLQSRREGVRTPRDADRARRREAGEGQVLYRNRGTRSLDTPGLAIGLAISGLAVAVSIWWTLHPSR